MDDWHAVDIVTEALRRQHTAYVTPEGAAWLASASAFPRSVEALWSARPTAPSALPCGTRFDVVNLPALFGRRVLEQLWAAGPGSGPVALHRGRVLLLVAPGTAQRLPSLLAWEEWARAVPPLLCHGAGDAVTVPALYGCTPAAAPSPSGRTATGTARPTVTTTSTVTAAGATGTPRTAGTGTSTATDPRTPERPESADRAASGDAAYASRWVVAPDSRDPWLPGPEIVLWACVRAARSRPDAGVPAQLRAPGGV